LSNWCGGEAWSNWHLCSSVYLGEVGEWTLETLYNGAVVATDHFKLVPYTMENAGGNGQSIGIGTSTPLPLSVQLKRPDGSSAPYRQNVVFTLASSPNGKKGSAGGLSTTPGYSGSSLTSVTVNTDENGVAKAYFQAGNKAGNYTVTATSRLAPGTEVVFSGAITGTDPSAVAQDNPKNQGDPSVDHGSCGVGSPPAGAIRGNTANPINIGTGNKYLIESDYMGEGPFPLRFVRYYNSMASAPGSLGGNWRSHFDRSLSVVTTVPSKGKAVPTTTAKVTRPDGKTYTFILSNGLWQGEPDVFDKLVTLPGGGYSYTCAADQTEIFSNTGRLLSISARGGTFTQVLGYDAQDRLVSVTDAFGRQLAFGYDASGRLASMTDPANQTHHYSYDASNNLVGVVYPDFSARDYLYENASFVHAVTGILDENDILYARYEYDNEGRATLSQLASNANVSRVHYYTDGSRAVVDGNGGTRKYGFSVIQGVTRRTSLDNGACGSCGSASTITAYDANGFVNSVTDYRGIKTTYMRNALGLETSRTEAVGTPLARTITTTWHATYMLPLSIAEPGRITTFTYDPTGRLLTRTETDTGSNANRRWAHSYNAQGLLASVDGPRTDVSDVISYTYDAQGNLATATNALGHVTRYTAYDVHGHPLSITDPNGLVSTQSYDLRGRLTSRNEGGLITQYSHDGVGQTTRVTRPDGSWLGFVYDDAHRLSGVMDQQGNLIRLSRDSNGNILEEEVSDAADVVTRQRSWAYDQLNRVTQEIDAQSRVQQRYGYDANGNPVQQTDALGNSTSLVYDVHNRLSSRSALAGGTINLSYDARDNLTQVRDPMGMVTAYGLDGLNNRTSQTSPDSCVSNFSFDEAGNVKTRTWANGKSAIYTYDALNRLVQENHGAGAVISYEYDNTSNGNKGLGRLTGMSDPSGSTAWVYDAWGRVTQKRQRVGATELSTQYSYDAAGRLQTQTYPSGRQVSHSYANGRLSGLAVDGVPQLSNISWQPFGPIKGWTQTAASGNLSRMRSQDLNGQISSYPLGSGQRTLAYDGKGRLVQSGTQIYGYDAADRLTTEPGHSYTYDNSGNRLSHTSPNGSSSYRYEARSHRLQHISEANPQTSRFDAAGNLSSDGRHSYLLDARNRMVGVDNSAVSYQVNGLGQRVGKASTQGSQHNAYDEAGRVLGEYDSATVQETVYLDGLPVLLLMPGAVHYIDADQLGTPRQIRSATGQALWSWESDAFGTQSPNEDPDGTGQTLSYNLRMPGQLYDEETGLH